MCGNNQHRPCSVKGTRRRTMEPEWIQPQTTARVRDQDGNRTGQGRDRTRHQLPLWVVHRNHRTRTRYPGPEPQDRRKAGTASSRALVQPRCSSHRHGHCDRGGGPRFDFDLRFSWEPMARPRVACGRAMPLTLTLPGTPVRKPMENPFFFFFFFWNMNYPIQNVEIVQVHR